MKKDTYHALFHKGLWRWPEIRSFSTCLKSSSLNDSFWNGYTCIKFWGSSNFLCLLIVAAFHSYVNPVRNLLYKFILYTVTNFNFEQCSKHNQNSSKKLFYRQKTSPIQNSINYVRRMGRWMVPRVKENNPLSTQKTWLDFDEVLHIVY